MDNIEELRRERSKTSQLGGWLAWAVALLVATAIIARININDHETVENRLMATQSRVTLSAEERSEYKDGLASFTAGDAKPLDRWIKRLADAKRWGILPALPAGYDNPHVLAEDGKFILCPEYTK